MSNSSSGSEHTGPQKSKRLFSILASCNLLLCIPLALSAISRVEQGEDMLGYGGLSIVISLMVVLLLSGIILGQIALFRGEKPVALPSAALTLNVIALVYLLFNLPR